MMDMAQRKKEVMRKIVNDLKRTLKVPLRFHWSGIILPLLLMTSLGVLYGIIASIVIFSSVLFHEYGHVFMSQRHNVGVGKVMIFAMGAWALLDPYAITGRLDKQFWISLAGPAASFVLATLFFLLNVIFPNAIFHYFFIINIMFGVFNLLPAYPMDGGRILNSILSKRIGYVRGLEYSANISYVIAGIGGLLALINGYVWLVVMAGLVAYMAYREKEQTLYALRQLGYI